MCPRADIGSHKLDMMLGTWGRAAVILWLAGVTVAQFSPQEARRPGVQEFTPQEARIVNNGAGGNLKPVLLADHDLSDFELFEVSINKLFYSSDNNIPMFFAHICYPIP